MNSSLIDLLSVGVLVLLIVDGAAAVPVGRGRGGHAPGGGGGRGGGEGHPLCGRRDRGLLEVGLAPPLSPCIRETKTHQGWTKRELMR